ncbi:CBS domain-containing protein [Streptomyces sp. NPDC059506]|uniref:Hypoxic response protein Hrp1 n=1 Tax=Streptomyces thermolineatus TaxID=44033 RepID=A0ABN3KSZ6_9ACTN|nr:MULTISPECIES: CBS domain-containing protein [unclassified Streptomyces]MCZ2523394.1 CBS domain-containing protein [Streptomyces sp. HB2AG]PLW71444.1 CBS domain-containing protein [Streptomyces sp. DJ]QMV23248.1 CBS domain-containing protein [Streptomyces sp. SCUT-3]
MAKGQKMKAREIMHKGTQCVAEDQTLMDAARMMRDLGVGCVPICGTDDRLKGMITDRDIVVKCVAEGRSAQDIKAREFGGELYWIDADADISEALETMEQHQIKRLPVIDTKNNHRLIGMISEADLARNLSDEKLAEFVEHVYATA